MTIDYIVPGFDTAGIASGIKADGALDLALITSQVPCRAAATFTQNAFPAAPVLYDRQLLAFNPEQVHGVVINSGNANACTGVEGDVNTKRTAETVAQLLGANEHSIFVMSTGVIGVQLPIDTLLGALPKATQQLAANNWGNAAKAIMTTDTRPKLRTSTISIDGHDVRLTGISKGSGMIHPDMATMLSTIVTDVNISQSLLQQALSEAVGVSFNRISVDGDTSTNDTVLLLSNGLAGNPEITDDSSPAYRQFIIGLSDISMGLAQDIVRDGEGATKFISVDVNGAVDDGDAHQAANTIAISPLCKTAFFGQDANWGRLLMAVGRSGSQVDPNKCDLFITGGSTPDQRMKELQLVKAGQPLSYAEEDAAAIFEQPEIDIRVALGLGQGTATVWTCDMSYEYVKINGDYRT